MNPEPGSRRSTLDPGEFALQIGRYVWHLVYGARGDRSGRWLADRTDRSKGYWEKILNLRQALTTNDIQIVADLFGISPYQLIRDARTWNEDRNEKHSSSEVEEEFVGGLTDDELSNLDLSQGDVDLVATEDHSTVNEQEHPNYEDENQDHSED